MKRIKAKVNQKAELYPNLLDKAAVKNIRTFEDLAEHFLVPVHGFKDPDDFFTKASPITYFEYIRTPLLVLNAWDDPIIGEMGFPIELAKKSKKVYLETPQYGGHCGFLLAKSNYAFSEVRALEFFLSRGQ